jgi:hypothetical protein
LNGVEVTPMMTRPPPNESSTSRLAGTVDGAELTAGLDEPRRRRRVEVGAQSHYHHVGLERAGVRLDPAPHRVDGPDRGLDELDTRVDRVTVRVPDRLRRGAAACRSPHVV